MKQFIIITQVGGNLYSVLAQANNETQAIKDYVESSRFDEHAETLRFITETTHLDLASTSSVVKTVEETTSYKVRS